MDPNPSQTPSSNDETLNMNDSNLPFNNDFKNKIKNSKIPILTLDRGTFESGDAASLSSPLINEKVDKNQSNNVFETPKSQKVASTCNLKIKKGHSQGIGKIGLLSNLTTPKSKNRVTFGRDLSPQLYDKRDPTNTPLRLGERPKHKNKNKLIPKANSQSSTVNVELPVLDKTPQKNFLQIEKPQVSFYRDLSPEIFDTRLPSNTPVKRGEQVRKSRITMGSLKKSLSYKTENIPPVRGNLISTPIKKNRPLKIKSTQILELNSFGVLLEPNNKEKHVQLQDFVADSDKAKTIKNDFEILNKNKTVRCENVLVRNLIGFESTSGAEFSLALPSGNLNVSFQSDDNSEQKIKISELSESFKYNNTIGLLNIDQGGSRSQSQSPKNNLKKSPKHKKSNFEKPTPQRKSKNPGRRSVSVLDLNSDDQSYICLTSKAVVDKIHVAIVDPKAEGDAKGLETEAQKSISKINDEINPQTKILRKILKDDGLEVISSETVSATLKWEGVDPLSLNNVKNTAKPIRSTRLMKKPSMSTASPTCNTVSKKVTFRKRKSVIASTMSIIDKKQDGDGRVVKTSEQTSLDKQVVRKSRSFRNEKLNLKKRKGVSGSNQATFGSGVAAITHPVNTYSGNIRKVVKFQEKSFISGQTKNEPRPKLKTKHSKTHQTEILAVKYKLRSQKSNTEIEVVPIKTEIINESFDNLNTKKEKRKKASSKVNLQEKGSTLKKREKFNFSMSKKRQNAMLNTSNTFSNSSFSENEAYLYREPVKKSIRRFSNAKSTSRATGQQLVKSPKKVKSGGTSMVTRRQRNGGVGK